MAFGLGDSLRLIKRGLCCAHGTLRPCQMPLCPWHLRLLFLSLRWHPQFHHLLCPYLQHRRSRIAMCCRWASTIDKICICFSPWHKRCGLACKGQGSFLSWRLVFYAPCSMSPAHGPLPLLTQQCNGLGVEL